MTASPASPSPLPALLLTLSATTGLIDAISVLGLGGVFTANMTGNVVFLGFAMGGAEGFRPAPLAMALASFLLGALAAGRAAGHLSSGPVGRWLTVAACVETALIWAAAALSAFAGAEATEAGLLALIALLGAAMGFRNATIRRLGVPDLTTTVLTLTLTGIAADSTLAGGAAPNLGRRLGAVAALFGGALVGALLLHAFGLAVPAALAGAMILAATLAVRGHPTLQAPHRRG